MKRSIITLGLAGIITALSAGCESDDNRRRDSDRAYYDRHAERDGRYGYDRDRSGEERERRD